MLKNRLTKDEFDGKTNLVVCKECLADLRQGMRETMPEADLTLLERAILAAIVAHGGRQDKIGLPEILHPLSVLNRCKGESDVVMMAAVLHDTVEDGLLTEQYVRENFGERVAEVVMLVTRDKEKETYREYILRAVTDPDARKVKRADLNENLSRPRPPGMEGIEKRYEAALLVLLDAEREESS